MELQKFLEKYLSNYTERLEKYRNDKDLSIYYPSSASLSFAFTRDNFSEALQNFANDICERQRRMCYTHADKEDMLNSILDTPQPKIENL